MTRPDTHRAPRTALVAGALTVVTLAAHTAGGGAVDGISVAVVLALAVALAAGVANRRLGLTRLIPALVGAQVVLHLLMSVAGAHGSGHAVDSGWFMATAHGAAAIAIALIVTHADDMLAAWARFVRIALGAVLHLAAVPASDESSPAAVATAPRTLITLLHRLERRGPPMAWHLQPI